MNWRLKYWLAGLLLSMSNAALALSEWLERLSRKVLGRAPLPLFRGRVNDEGGK